MSQSFHTIDRFRLEVEDDPTGLLNLAQNPSGELGSWAYVTPVPNTAVTIDGIWKTLKFATTVAQAAHWKTELIPMAAGHYVAGRFDALAATNVAITARCRFEFYDSARALISSSPQGPALAFSFVAGQQVPPVQAPTGTVYVALRWDLYRLGGNLAAGDSAVFSGVTVCISPTSSDLGQTRRNLIANPSFETNAAGWTGSNGVAAVTPTRVSGGSVGPWRGRVYDPGTIHGSYPTVSLASALAGVTAGRSYHASAMIDSTNGAASLRLTWHSAAGAVLSTHTGYPTTGGMQRVTFLMVAPAGAVSARLTAVSSQPGSSWNDVFVDAAIIEEAATAGTYFDGTTPAADGWAYSWTGTAHASPSLASTSNLQYAEPIQYRDITGPTIEASIERDALNTGSLSAVIRDALLDPSRDDLIRPGRRVRATALDNAGVWQPLITGTMGKADVTYELKDPSVPASKRARIEIVAHDPQAVLANQERPQGVGTIPELAFVLEGCGIPWSINGSGNQVPNANAITDSPGQTALDQIVVTRDSRHGLAWIDRRGIVQIWDRAALPATPVATLTEAEYSGFDATWSSEDCINEVNIALRRLNLANGETVEVPYGPYRDAASVKAWGARSATFTVQGIADDAGAASAYANAVLAANANPQRRVSQVTYALQDASGFNATGSATAFRELCDLVRVKNTRAEFDRNLRVKSIKHKITSKKWLVELGFGEPGSVEVPTLVPPVQSAGTYATGARGTANLPGGAAGALEAHDVAFAQKFASPPFVMVNPVVADPAQYQVCAVAVTTTGFQIKLRRGASGTAAFPVTWLAATS